MQLEEDLLNYQDWMNGTIQRPKLKLQVPNSLKNVGNNILQSISFVQEITNRQKDMGILCKPQQHHKSVQVNPVIVHRSVGVKLKGRQKVVEEEMSLDEQDPSSVGSTVEFTETETESSGVQHKQEFSGRKFILSIIERNPSDYLGIGKQYFWIIEYIKETCNIPSLHVVLTLYKLKNNDTFSKMKDLFEVSISTLWRVFYKTLKILSLFFKQLLYWPRPLAIKCNLPPVFRCNVNYASVQSIVDAFEIEIETKKPIQQALTWSQYKQSNTIKYLISATPDGFINFISEGYSGRISDMYLVEQSGFLENVPEHATILADRGFKHLESHLIQKSVKVLRPPSVAKDTKMTKNEVVDSKVIASLRIHIERVIRRVRLFKLLKPHSVVNNKLVNILDDAVIVACGLINLQTPIIKT